MDLYILGAWILGILAIVMLSFLAILLSESYLHNRWFSKIIITILKK